MKYVAKAITGPHEVKRSAAAILYFMKDCKEAITLAKEQFNNIQSLGNLGKVVLNELNIH